MAYIYKITNLINNHIYIGYTSKIIKQRYKRHCIDARYKFKCKKDKLTYLQKAIIKYGENSFKIEEVYKIPKSEEKNWSNIEKEYIKKYNATLKGVGYNITEGGEAFPKIFGEKNIHANLTDLEVNEIVDLLKESNLTFDKISKKYNVSITTIERINKGKIRYYKELNYPIRKYKTNEIKAEKCLKLLIYTNLKYSIIGDIVGVGKDVPSYINKGHRYKKLFKNIKYPVRKNIEYNKQFCKLQLGKDLYMYNYLKIKYCSKYEKRALSICVNLITTDNIHSFIAEKYNVDTALVTKINTGRHYKKFLDMFIFPIRNNIKENKKILDEIEAVETIPLIGK